jgi:Bacterial Ig-like domain
MTSPIRWAVAAFAAALVLPGGAFAATTVGQLFPSNIYTEPDGTQMTGLHVALPQPTCATNPSDCADVALLDQLDGFNIQPRLTIPFSAAIDPQTISSSTVFLVGPDGARVGINQVVVSSDMKTVYAESDRQLAQDTTYLLVVTTGVRDANGDPVDATTFRHDLNFGQTKDPALKAYRKSLLDMLPLAGPSDVAAAGVFTTQSITAISDKIRSQLQGSPVNFTLGTNGERTVFPLAQIAGIQLRRQNGTSTFATSFLPTIPLFTHGIGMIAFGSYASPDYETPAAVIPAVGTRTGVPAVQSTNQLEFTLFLPEGTPPSGGWPTAIFGHGFTDSKDGAPWIVAGTLAQNGIATIAINVVGHGGGPAGSYTALRTNAPPVTWASGGRSVDQNGDGNFGDQGTEGVSAFGTNTLIGNRDGLRQTTIDLMQLVKVLEGGVDVDGDHAADLSRSRIYYFGQSFGGIYGVQLLGLEPDIRAGVPNVPGGSIIDVARLGGFRPLVGIALLTRSPSLYNAVPNASFTNFNENIPLRNLHYVTATPDQLAIQTVIDNTEWAQQAANPAAYAPYLSHPVIIQFARGDETVPNPTTSAILRAGGLAARATLFRNDLAHRDFGTGANPHTFLTNVFNFRTNTLDPGAPFALEAQQQIATFFVSDGATTIDPDGAGPYFETPTSIVPEDLAFIP